MHFALTTGLYGCVLQKFEARGRAIDMRSYLRKKLADLRRSTCGNATMMTALGLPALLGATGYGVDTAQWYMWQRELQHSVDQAAIGGAWALAYDRTSTAYTLRAQQEYYANQNITADFDSTPTIRLADYNGGNDNSVLVTATVTRSLPFSSLLLNRTTTIGARAQAAFEAGSKYNACLITLKENGTTFQVGGNAQVIANCGLGALSCSDNAIVIDGSATVETTSIAACGTVTNPAKNESAVHEKVTNLSDAYAEIPVPEPDESTPKRAYKCDGNGKKAIASLQPGIYEGGITVSCQTTFNPGIYYIDGGTLDMSTNAPVVGTNVLFVLRKGAQLKLGGQGGTGSISLTPMQEAHFIGTDYEDEAALLSQMLFIEDKTGETEPADHQINGNSELNLEGVIYLPNGNVQINGTSGSRTDLCFQISAYTLDIRGNAYLKTLCEYDSSSELGSTTPGVRLIA